METPDNASSQSASPNDILHQAVRKGKKEFVEFLLELQTSVTAVDGDGNIPLHIAIECNHRDIAAILLRTKAVEQLYKANKLHQTPYDLITTTRPNWRDLIRHLQASSSTTSSQTSHEFPSTSRRPNQGNEKSHVVTSSVPNAGNGSNSLGELPIFADGQKTTANAVVGFLYQIKVLALLFLLARNKQNYHGFRLLTEVHECGKFDDVVFECGGRAQLMQIKHKSKNKPIASDDICSKEERDKLKAGELNRTHLGFSFKKYLELLYEESKKDARETKRLKGKPKDTDFSLAKYFESYCNLEEQKRLKVKELIILTNTKFTEECREYFLEDPLEQDHILYLRGHASQRFMIAPEHAASENPLVGEFLQKFRFVLDFLNEDDINKFISAEVGNISKMRHSGLVTDSFLKRLETWFKKLEGNAITNDSLDGFYNEIDGNLDIVRGLGLHQTNCDRLQLHSLGFKEDFMEVNDFLDDSTQSALRISTSSPQLTSARIIQQLMFKNLPNDDFMFILSENISRHDTEASKWIWRLLSSDRSFKIVVVLCEDNERRGDLFKKLYESLIRKLIFISEGSFSDVENCLPETDEALRAVRDCPSFADLNSDCQNDLKSKMVTFQGRTVQIRDILSDEAIGAIFKPETLYDFMTSRSTIEICCSWEARATNRYMTRTLERNEGNDTSLRFEETHFYEPKCEDKIVLACGDPGLGKSFLFTSLQQNMNHIDQLIWAIKLNLNDFAHDVDKEFHFDRIDFSETETDKAIEFICKMVVPKSDRGQLTRDQNLSRELLSFCLKRRPIEKPSPKVILLFDGFDEIAPRYTGKVTTLLRSLSRTNIEQMWISTRKHEMKTIGDGLAQCKCQAEFSLPSETLDRAKESFAEISHLGKLRIFLKKKQPGSDSDDNCSLVGRLPTISVSGKLTIQSDVFRLDDERTGKGLRVNVSLKDCLNAPPTQWVSIVTSAKECLYIQQLSALSELLSEQCQSSFRSSDFLEPLCEFTNESEILLDFAVHLSASSNVKITAAISRLREFILLNLSDAEKAKFLYEYFAEIRSRRHEPEYATSIENLQMLFSVIGYDYSKGTDRIELVEKSEERDESSDDSDDQDYAEKLERLVRSMRAFGESRADSDAKINKTEEKVQTSLRTLLDNPLHLNMLAQLALAGELKFSSDTRLHLIYKALIGLKETTFSWEKQNLKANAQVSKVNNDDKARSLHRRMARALLLNEQDHQLGELPAADQEMLLKFGVTALRAGRMEFVHRSFAEYLLADDLLANIEDPANQAILLEKVLVRKEFNLVRSFLDSLLSEVRMSPSLKLPVPSAPRNGKRPCLKKVSEEGHLNILKMLLRTLESGTFSCYDFIASWQTDYETLFEQNSEEAKCLFSDRSNFNRQTLSSTKELIEKKLTHLCRIDELEGFIKMSTNFRKVLLKKDSQGNSVLHFFYSKLKDSSIYPKN